MGKQILVVPSTEARWAGVIRALERLPYVRAVLSAPDRRYAAELADRYPPHAVVVAAAPQSERAVRAVTRLRRHLPESCPIAVVGQRFEPEVIPALHRLGVRGFLLWDELTPDLLVPSLAAFVGGMTVASPSLGTVRPTPDPIGSVDPTGVLTEREHQVLRDLSEGLGEEQIANAEHLSVRSVRRAIASTKEKLGASTMFLLGRASAQLAIDFQPNVAITRSGRR